MLNHGNLILLFVKGYKSKSLLMFSTLSQCVPLQEELHELKKRKTGLELCKTDRLYYCRISVEGSFRR